MSVFLNGIARTRRICSSAAGCRLPAFQEAEEPLDRRQPHVARHGRVFALVLEMLEEGTDEPRIDLLERQRRWFDLKPLGGEHEEQLEARGIGVARVPAGASLAGERVAQERLDERSDRCHADLPSIMNASPAVATSRKRSAVASRYQYVA